MPHPPVPALLGLFLALGGCFLPSRTGAPAPGDAAPANGSAASEAARPAPPAGTSSPQDPGAGPLVVSPLDRWTLSGKVGGPFEPATRTFHLANSGSAPVHWNVSSQKPGLRWSAERGDLAPGEETDVTAALDLSFVRGREPGTYGNAVIFRADGKTQKVCLVELAIEAPPPSADLGTVTQLASFGVTWRFAGEHRAGTYVTGDPWVVGPVRIVEISPPSVRHGDRVVNGSMLNPSPRDGQRQGYDSTMYGKYRDAHSFDAALDVALGVSEEQPLEVPSGSSLVSTISVPEPGARPQLRSASVLTVVAEPPAPDSFRPPYCGKDKSSRFHASQLKTSLLAHLKPVQGTPSIQKVEHMFERPWIDHVPLWVGSGYSHPEQNLPNYGRELSEQVGYASLMLNLDFSDEAKHTLLVRFVQVGIDFYGVLSDGGRQNWVSGAGWCHGRKWAILFAGMLLDDPDMSGIGLDPDLLFQGEDGETFYVEETSPGVFDGGHGDYGPQHAGMAEWGIKHATDPSEDDVSWGARYRECCTANAWWGEVLSARIMPGARQLWNHEALFDYQDRYFDVTRKNDSPGWIVSWSEFPIRMWRTYRPKY